MEMPERFLTSNDFRVINDKSIKISKKFFARGLNDIRIDSMVVIEDDVILRGDLAKIQIGVGTILDNAVVLHPCLSSISPPFDYKPLIIGSHCYIGQNTVCSARTIGNYVYVGKNVIIGDRAEIGNNIKILDNSYVPPDVKLVDNSAYGGFPVRFLGEISEGFENKLEDFCNNYYKKLIVSQTNY